MSGKAAALTALGTSASASSRTQRRSRSRKYAKSRAVVDPGLPTAFVRGVQKGKTRSKGKAKARQPFSKRKALKKIVTLQRKGRKLKNKVKAVPKKDTKAADAKVEACNVELEEYRKGLATQQATIKSLSAEITEKTELLHRRINDMKKASKKAHKPPHHPLTPMIMMQDIVYQNVTVPVASRSYGVPIYAPHHRDQVKVSRIR